MEAVFAGAERRATGNDEGSDVFRFQESIGCVGLEEPTEDMDVGLGKVSVVSGIEGNSMSLDIVRSGLVREIFRIVVDI